MLLNTRPLHTYVVGSTYTLALWTAEELKKKKEGIVNVASPEERISQESGIFNGQGHNNSLDKKKQPMSQAKHRNQAHQKRKQIGKWPSTIKDASSGDEYRVGMFGRTGLTKVCSLTMVKLSK